VIDLIFFLCLVVFLMEGGHDAAAGKHIPAFVVLERLFECGDDGVDDSSDVVIVIDAIEIVIDVFEGPH
jgi:hypothetical protein